MVSTVRTRDRSGGEEGVYYRHEDYAGFWRRLVVDLIDVVVVPLLFFACGLVAWLADPGEELPTDALLVFVLAGLSYGYFVLLKGSPLRTLGYRIGRVRVVNLQGEPPGLFSLTIRFLFSVLGPLNFGLELIWIPSDKSRQALRDKFAHTYVIRADAQPAGRGKILYATYYILGATLVFQEVAPSRQSQAP